MSTELDRLYDALPAFLKDDTRTEAERAYDDLKSGAIYTTPADYTPCSPAWEAVLSIRDDPTNDGRARTCRRATRPIGR